MAERIVTVDGEQYSVNDECGDPIRIESDSNAAFQCRRCGSLDTWEDNLTYGCRACGHCVVGNQ